MEAHVSNITEVCKSAGESGTDPESVGGGGGEVVRVGEGEGRNGSGGGVNETQGLNGDGEEERRGELMDG